MLPKLLTQIFGSRNERLLKTYRKVVQQINALEPQFEALDRQWLVVDEYGADATRFTLAAMAAQGRDFLFMAPHIATVPSLAIFVVVLCANLLGDALRDIFDPRRRT